MEVGRLPAHACGQVGGLRAELHGHELAMRLLVLARHRKLGRPLLTAAHAQLQLLRAARASVAVYVRSRDAARTAPTHVAQRPPRWTPAIMQPHFSSFRIIDIRTCKLETCVQLLQYPSPPDLHYNAHTLTELNCKRSFILQQNNEKYI